jgi:hypothetical protein
VTFRGLLSAFNVEVIRMRTSSLAYALAALLAGGPAAQAADPPLVRSKQSGAWSAKETWDADRVPAAGDRVVIRAGHHVGYDVDSRAVLRLVQVVGTLEFARDKNTRLEAGLITLTADEEPSEEGFNCHARPKSPAEGQPRPALLIGTPGAPVPAGVTATVRLHYVAGMDKASCPALVNCGGRLEIHGTPIRSTWVKLKKTAEVGVTTVALDESVADWKAGDTVILTGTKMQRDRGGRGDGPTGGFIDSAQTEVRTVTRVGRKDFTGGYPLTFDKPLTFSHYAEGNFRGEVANLTRNVVVESADPDGVRGHTMVHKHSAGSITYAEFRHLGKRDELGRYSLHFHECGDTMRGSSVVGCSIWDSHNRFLTIHGTDGMVVRDNVGYKSVGHGFFLEDGTEVNNVLDRNLAAVVGPGKPLPKQVIPFDLNRGAGFWWANCQNQFTRNVAAECAEYGFRFECKQTADFDPVQPIRQGDGTVKKADTRVMPFIRFQDNEAHTMRFFCLNLRGIARPVGGGLDIPGQQRTLAREAAAAIPEPGHPFWIRDFRAWEANWSVHLGTTGVFVDGLDSFRNDVAIWRSIMDGSGYRRMTSREMRVNDIHNPLGMGYPLGSEEADSGDRRKYGGVSSFKDDRPPVTLITSTVREGNLIRVRGSVADTSDIKAVVVNGRPARSTRDSYAEWEVTLEAVPGKPLEVVASAEDVNGNVEKYPHRVRVE